MNFIEDHPDYETLAAEQHVGLRDPRQRVCKEHGKAFESDGGGPSPFSECPDCYARAMQRGPAKFEDFVDPFR